MAAIVRPDDQVNRHECEAPLSALNRQSGSTLALAAFTECSLVESIRPFDFAYANLKMCVPRAPSLSLSVQMLTIGFPLLDGLQGTPVRNRDA